jgi:hypothetical protein
MTDSECNDDLVVWHFKAAADLLLCSFTELLSLNSIAKVELDGPYGIMYATCDPFEHSLLILRNVYRLVDQFALSFNHLWRKCKVQLLGLLSAERKLL